MTRNDVIGLFAVKMHSLDTLFYVRIKLNDIRCEIPPAPLFERGETSLARHFLRLPPFAKGDGGGFSCVGATNIQVMSVYETIKLHHSEFLVRHSIFNYFFGFGYWAVAKNLHLDEKIISRVVSD